MERYTKANLGNVPKPVLSQPESSEISNSNSDVPTEWKFITSPGNISWSKDGQISDTQVYGTNEPAKIYGFTSLRKLDVSECLVEGFSENKIVEDHILALEKLMEVQINTDNGFASPFVWRFTAGSKLYGNFLISSLNITEVLRDSTGKATRCLVDISLVEVPDFQINDGRDLASKDDLAQNNQESQNSLKQKNPVINSDEGVPDGVLQEDSALIQDSKVSRTSFYGTGSILTGGDGFGPGTSGNITASGVPFNPNSLIAAHPSLPFGTKVNITNRENNLSTIVTILDRGPWVGGEEIQISRAAASEISIILNRIKEVDLEVIE